MNYAYEKSNDNLYEQGLAQRVRESAQEAKASYFNPPLGATRRQSTIPVVCFVALIFLISVGYWTAMFYAMSEIQAQREMSQQ